MWDKAIFLIFVILSYYYLININLFKIQFSNNIVNLVEQSCKINKSSTIHELFDRSIINLNVKLKSYLNNIEIINFKSTTPPIITTSLAILISDNNSNITYTKTTPYTVTNDIFKSQAEITKLGVFIIEVHYEFYEKSRNIYRIVGQEVLIKAQRAFCTVINNETYLISSAYTSRILEYTNEDDLIIPRYAFEQILDRYSNTKDYYCNSVNESKTQENFYANKKIIAISHNNMHYNVILEKHMPYFNFGILKLENFSDNTNCLRIATRESEKNETVAIVSLSNSNETIKLHSIETKINTHPKLKCYNNNFGCAFMAYDVSFGFNSINPADEVISQYYGSPIINRDGEVIGIFSSTSIEGRSLHRLLQNYEATKNIGLYRIDDVQFLDKKLTANKWLHLGEKNFEAVVSNSSLSNILPGDLIVGCNGKNVSTIQTLLEILLFESDDKETFTVNFEIKRFSFNDTQKVNEQNVTIKRMTNQEIVDFHRLINCNKHEPIPQDDRYKVAPENLNARFFRGLHDYCEIDTLSNIDPIAGSIEKIRDSVVKLNTSLNLIYNGVVLRIQEKCGTCFFVKNKNNKPYCMTNHHVVDMAFGVQESSFQSIFLKFKQYLDEHDGLEKFCNETNPNLELKYEKIDGEMKDETFKKFRHPVKGINSLNLIDVAILELDSDLTVKPLELHMGDFVENLTVVTVGAQKCKLQTSTWGMTSSPENEFHGGFFHRNPIHMYTSVGNSGK